MIHNPGGSRRTAALFKAAVFSWLQAAIPYMIDYSQDCRIFAALSDDKNLPMPINKDTLYFFRLVRSGAGLGAAPVSDTADTAVTPGSWERIYRMAADHGLSAVVWDGICRLPAAQQPPRETRIRWALSAEKLEERYRHQQQTASKLAARFSEEGLRMLLLKGLGLSRDYPLPEHRECGDIDIYLYGQSDKGDRVLHEIGAHLYFDVPKHSEYVWDGVLIENHRTILNVRRNRTERELNAVLVRLLEKEGTHGLAPGIQAPRATFNAIFLIRHAAVHFQKEGIVLRHLCDWACFLTRHWDEIDHALFRTAMEDYRMDRFADLMTAAAVEYLGAEVPGPECEAGMLGRFMEEVLTLSPMPDKPLPRLLRKLSGPYRNRWRLRKVLRTPVWRYYYDTVRGQWNEKFTVFR